MSEVRDDLFYTKDHEWVLFTGTKAKIGITDYAQQSLGDVTFVELPSEGTEYKKGDILANIESVKAASDIYSPLSGKVVAVNYELENTPEAINDSPYDKAWIAEIELSDVSEKENLLLKTDYADYIASL